MIRTGHFGNFIFAVAAIVSSAIAAPPTTSSADAFAANRLIGRGINFGNCLEAPREGEWGVTLKEEFLGEVASAGFDSVRIPIRWSAHARIEAPYTIDSKFLERTDQIVEQALSRKLAVVINVHHYEEMDKDPETHLPRLKAIWRQVAERYRDRPERLFFELLNEPHDKLTEERWQEVFPQLLAAVRESNPERMVIIGPAMWNGIRALKNLRLPEDDRRLIVTVHYYLPYEFTHQGAPWDPKSANWKGRTWTATPEQRDALRKDFEIAADWSKAHDRPIFLGEFGAYHEADMPSRAAWTRAVAREAERHGFSWTYWEFGAGFGAYDRRAGRWHDALRDALLGTKSD
jgi:endoglucanase